MSRVRFLVALIAMVMLQPGCGVDPSEPEPPDDEREEVGSLIIQASSHSPLLSTLTVEVSAADIDSPLVFNAEVVNGAATLTVEITAGSARLIEITGFDLSGIETHFGSVTTDVRDGSNAPISVTLEPLSGELPVNVTIGYYLVSVLPAVDTVSVGEMVQLTATVVDSNGDTLASPSVTWASTNPAVAAVDGSGLLVGHAAGRATLVAAYAGHAANASVVVLAPSSSGVGLILFSDGVNLNLMSEDGSNVRSTIPDADHSDLSADGSRVVYRPIVPFGSNEIWVADSGGAGATRISSGGVNYVPRWSNDATRIVFIKEVGGGAAGRELLTMNPDGSGVLQLTNDGFEDNTPSFSPDGSSLVFSTLRDGNEEIYVVASDGSNLTRLTNDAGSDTEPLFSPDGTSIVFTSNRDGNPEIYVMDSDGSNQTRVTSDPAIDANPVFSPDGQRIAFVSHRGGQADVYTIAIDGSGLTRLTNTAAVEAVWQWR